MRLLVPGTRLHAQPHARTGTHAPARAPRRVNHARSRAATRQGGACHAEREGDAPGKEAEVKEDVITEILEKDGRGHSREVALLGAFIATRRGISRGIVQSIKHKDQSSDTAATAVMAVDEDESDVLLAASEDGKSNWVLDLGSAYHLCRDREVFFTYSAYEGRIWMANNTSSRVVSRGQSGSAWQTGVEELSEFPRKTRRCCGERRWRAIPIGGSVQSGGATVNHGSSGISKENGQGKQPLHRGTQSKRRGTWRIRGGTRAQGDALGYVQKSGQTRLCTQERRDEATTTLKVTYFAAHPRWGGTPVGGAGHLGEKFRMADGRSVTLTEVRHVPNLLRKNLISIGMLDSKGCSFDASGGTLRVSKENKEMLWGKKIGGLYRLEGSVQSGGATVNHGSSGISKENGQEEATVAQRYAKQAQGYLEDPGVVQERREMLWDMYGSLARHESCNQCRMSIEKLRGRRPSQF
ncbi:hypothetical protein Acr_15g0007510 [Actinidia rufa]|uniref:Uncharacterized protein n=1 Tax=Actinidia rufa TaxID=165716 RepID=A0A7J0FTW7_9ERIC|nr:hypothetical protein Acr_15g0007510 [Actinidia rufa]